MPDEQTTPEEQVETTEEEHAETAAEEPSPEQEQAPPPEMRTEDALRFAISLFADLAWINMGIRANPATNETKADLGQARLAIDAITALVQLTGGRLDPREVREMNNMLSTLRLNYVERAAK
jgi:hypothetical protein